MDKNKPLILAVDDDALALKTIEVTLSGAYNIRVFESPAEAEAYLVRYDVRLVILDFHFPDQNGLTVLKRWSQKYPSVQFVFCSGENDARHAMACIQEGAADYVVKPFRASELRTAVERALEKSELQRKAEKLGALLSPAPQSYQFESPVMKDLFSKISFLKGQEDISVMLLGESGTGKEVLAKLIYQQEENSTRPFVVANMPALPPSLIEAELFGVEKFAYTDAKSPRPGKFELADGGDIFLDEIGDLPYEMQAKILRTVQEKQVQRIGSQKEKQVKFRVISATNQPIEELVRNGKFREDLFYRLTDVVFKIPPLRERKEDIIPLAHFFLTRYSRGQQIPSLSPNVRRALIEYSWPGNVRQLESVIKRTLIFQTKPEIEALELNERSFHDCPPAQFNKKVLESEKKLIQETLSYYSGDRVQAMEALGLSRASFYRKLSEFKDEDTPESGCLSS